jgi:hypothetical protein
MARSHPYQVTSPHATCDPIVAGTVHRSWRHPGEEARVRPCHVRARPWMLDGMRPVAAMTVTGRQPKEDAL